MNWSPSNVAVGTKGTYRVVPLNPEEGGPPGYECHLTPTGFPEEQSQLLLSDPSAVNARCRADAYDRL